MEIQPVFALAVQNATLVPATRLLGSVCKDPDDDEIPTCARASGTDIVARGDKKLHATSVYDGIQVLTPREYRLLRHLIKHRDQTLDHEQILEAVWGRDGKSERPSEVLKQYIWRLRQKIEPDPNHPDTIVTDPGAGYRFVSRLD